jgi:hypothetical protein
MVFDMHRFIVGLECRRLIVVRVPWASGCTKSQTEPPAALPPKPGSCPCRARHVTVALHAYRFYNTSRKSFRGRSTRRIKPSRETLSDMRCLSLLPPLIAHNRVVEIDEQNMSEMIGMYHSFFSNLAPVSVPRRALRRCLCPSRALLCK